ncbi:MAG: mechanosensitive ion channel [Rhodobacterales bacterium]|nr:mechanosensitive ion channel [Rhodobacterales bacterium]
MDIDWQRVGNQAVLWWETGGWTQAALLLLGSTVLAVFVRWFFRHVIMRFVDHTKTDLDDQIAHQLQSPVGWSVQILGVWYAVFALNPSDEAGWIITGGLGSWAVFLWSRTLSRISHLMLEWLVQNSNRYAYVNQRTLPVFDFASTAIVWGGAAFMLFEVWGVNPAGWLASAGVVGVAVGFAAQDTMSNLMAGVVILADAPYKLGDFLDLDNGARGRVVEIGIRTTRLVTPDDVEIIVPNAMMATTQIVNPSGGPSVKYRVTVDIGVAYGTDIDALKAMLLEETHGVSGLIQSPAPAVLFKHMGDSALIFGLVVWITEPGLQPMILDALNTKIY